MKQKVLYYLVPLFIIFFLAIAYFQQQIAKQTEQNAYDNIKIVLNKILDDEKNKSLALAIGLSKNTILRDSLIQNDKKLGYKTLSESVEYLEKYVKKTDVYSQILTKDLFVFARSWDEVFSGLPLDSFRADLKEMQLSKKPKVEIEVGRLISIKASVPIQNEEQIVGTLEIITRLDVLVDQLREFDLELVPLMHSEYMDSAYLMNEHQMLDHDRIVANLNHNQNTLDRINKLTIKEFRMLRQKGYFQKGNYYFASYEMLNNKAVALGEFIVVANMDKIEQFYGNSYSVLQSIFNLNSTDKDIYDFISYKDRLNTINLEPDSQQREIAKTKLEHLSKEELIEYILNEQNDQIIRGRIE